MAIVTLSGKLLSDAASASAGSAYPGPGDVDTLVGTAQTDSDTAQAAVPSTTTVAANVATLVADGASPTQGHVTTLNTNCTAFLTALGTYNIATALVDTDVDAAKVASAAHVPSGNVIVSIDLASVNTLTKLNKVLRAIEKAAIAAGYITY